MALKGQYLVIDAMRSIPQAHLYLAGAGPDAQALRQQAERAELADRVHFLGVLNQPTLRDWYGAADVSILASSHEGMANVLLESMACGTPVLATHVWGTPEVVSDPRAGRLTARSSEAIADHLRVLLTDPLDRHAVRSYAETFNWRDTSARLYQLFSQISAPAS
jgi:glycosyltransferase involved in cell wall biosynthesis